MSFILKPGDPVYYPFVSNSILETEGCGRDKDILQIKKPSIYLTEDNKLKEVSVTYFMKDVNLAFPATKLVFNAIAKLLVMFKFAILAVFTIDILSLVTFEAVIELDTSKFWDTDADLKLTFELNCAEDSTFKEPIILT